MRGAGRAQRVLPTPLQPADCPAEPAENLVRETGIKGEVSVLSVTWMRGGSGWNALWDPTGLSISTPKLFRGSNRNCLSPARGEVCSPTPACLHSLPGLSHCGACLLTELHLPLSPGMACFQGCFLLAHPAHPAWRQVSLSFLLCGSPLCPSRLQPSLPSLLSSVSGFRWQ